MPFFKKVRQQVRQSLRQLVYSITDWRVQKKVETLDKTLVIVKSDLIGDYILFRNFLPYIRQSEKYKDYKIILIGNSVWKNIAESLDSEYYDEMIWISFDRLFKDLSYRSKTIKSVLSRGYETLFYPVYSGDLYTELFFISKIQAKEKIKFSPDSLERQTEIVPFNVLMQTPHKELFEVYRYKEMMETFFGISIDDFNWRTLASTSTVEQKPYIVLFPGSSAYLKRWSTGHFIKVANHLAAHYPYKIAIAGSKKDSKYADAIVAGMEPQFQDRIIDYTGKTSLLELATLIDGSELLITNDSASIHMAAVSNKEAICVFMGENYGRFAPYPTALYDRGTFICPPEVERLVSSTEGEVFLDLDYNPDINAISPQVVIDASDSILLKKEKAYCV